MKIEGFDWDDQIALKIEGKHGILPAEFEEAALGSPHVRRVGAGLYYLYGRTDSGRYLFAVFRYLGKGVIRPITARDMNEAQRRLYLRATGS